MPVRREPRGWTGRAAPLVVLAAALASLGATPAADDGGLGFAFREVAQDAGLRVVTVFGGKDTNRYLLETTGTGVALFDYDGDGRLDVFLVNGTTLEGFPRGQEPTNHLYRNRGDGTFEDVTAAAGLAAGGLGTGRVRGGLSTTTATRTSSSPTTARTVCIHNRGDGASRT